MANTDANNSFPATGVLVVTPSDTADLIKTVRAIRANTAGTVKITAIDGTAPTLNFYAGETRPVAATRIWLTGTTATGIEGMY